METIAMTFCGLSVRKSSLLLYCLFRWLKLFFTDGFMLDENHWDSVSLDSFVLPLVVGANAVLKAKGYFGYAAMLSIRTWC